MIVRLCALLFAVTPACSTPANTPPTGTVGDAPAAEYGYTCPMHAEVRQPGPGRCPKCGMDLVPATGAPPADALVLPDTLPGSLVAIEERQAALHELINAGKLADVPPITHALGQLAVGVAVQGKALPAEDAATLTVGATTLTDQARALGTAAAAGDAAATQRALEALDAAIAGLARFKG